MLEMLLVAPLTTAMAAFLIHRLRSPAIRLGLVDQPDDRKTHNGSVPLVGGIAMFVAFAAGALLVDAHMTSYRPLFTGAGLLLITGTLDDLHDLRPGEKLCLQLLGAGILAFWGGLSIDTLGTLPMVGEVALGWLSIPFTLVCILGLINAINMIDGLNGLCGGVTLSILFWLVAAGAIAGAPAASLLLPILLGASILGFLLFNMPRKGLREPGVFMGDAGSTMLGFVVSWFAIELVFQHDLNIPPISIAWVLALPVFDTISLMIRRTLKGQNPMTSDREHLHHIFERAGFSRPAITYMLIVCSFALGAIGVCTWWAGLPESFLWPPLALLLGVYFLVVLRAWRAMRLLRRLRPWLGPFAAEPEGATTATRNSRSP